MKLKYLIETDEKYLFANCLNDLGAYYNVTVSGMKYKIKNKLVNVTKINNELQDLKFDYTIDKYGVVSALKNDIYKVFEADNVRETIISN